MKTKIKFTVIGFADLDEKYRDLQVPEIWDEMVRTGLLPVEKIEFEEVEDYEFNPKIWRKIKDYLL